MKIVTFGELLYRLSPPQNLRFSQTNSFGITVGGAEANTAISLSQFGNEVTYVTAVPNNELGKSALREMSKWQVDTRHCKLQGERMGLYFLEKGASLRSGNLIYDRAYSSFSQIDGSTFNWKEILKNADVFHWTGITPAVSHGAALACEQALIAAKELGLTISCDLNYRSKLWKYGMSASEIMPNLIQYCDILLANEHDVENYIGIKPAPSDYEEIEGFGKRAHKFVSMEMAEQFPKLNYIVSTLRETVDASRNRWSSVLFDGENWYSSRSFEINNIVDRVGGGDSFMGALLHAIFKMQDRTKMLDFATAASALKLSIEGDYNILSEQEVLDMLESNRIGQITR